MRVNEFCCFLRSVTFVAQFFGRFLRRTFPRIAVKVGVVTKEAPQSKKLREWNGIFTRCGLQDECSK